MKVSVIVPVYGVEKYIGRCAESLFAQTLDRVEFIFIDDCTPDRSITLLQEEIARHAEVIAEKHWQVRTERMPQNSGQAAVRKFGIQSATGNYIAFCDSDDWAEATLLEDLLAAAEKSDSEIVYCEYFTDNGQKATPRQRFRHFEQSPKTLMKRMMTGQENGSLWGALYKRSVFQGNIVYPTGNMGEDLALNIQFLFNASTPVALLQKPLYHYFINESSISNNPSEGNIERNFRFMNQNADAVCRFFAENNAAAEYSAELKSLRLLACRPLTPLLGKGRYYRLWRQQVATIEGSILFDFRLPLGVRLHYLCSWLRIIPLLSSIKHKIQSAR